MGKWWLLLGALTLLPLAQAESLRTINLVTEQWPGHTNPDGTGLAFDLLRKVYEPEGIELHYRIVPYTRSVGLVQRGEADAFVGAYPNEVPQVLFPRWHYDADQINALGLIDKPVPTLETLGGVSPVLGAGVQLSEVSAQCARVPRGSPARGYSRHA